ncbi:MAG: DUF5719 family protein [Micrococcales bacterium]|nr:DUF5719 family protein [Micrococcales bacterium]
MTTPWIRASASVGSALLLVAAALGLTWLDRNHPPGPWEEGKALDVIVDSGSSRAVCPGQMRLATEGAEGEDIAYDRVYIPQPAEVSSQVLGVVGAGKGAQVWTIGSTERSALREGETHVLSQPATPASLALASGSGRDGTTMAAGGVLFSSTAGDLRGLAGASCILPRSDSYILAGSTEVGSSALLTVVNPGATAVTADVTLWGAAGVIETVGASGLVIPPDSERVVRLEGLTGGEDRLAVRVSASGGELAVYLQHTRLEGLVSAGVDIAVPGAPPATEVALGGIVTQETTLDTTDPTVLRLLAPGDLETRVSVAIFGPEGELDLPATEDIVLPPAEVTDIPLLGIPTGTYSAIVTADHPVLVAAMSTTGGEGGAEPFEVVETAGEDGVDEVGEVHGSAREITWSSGEEAQQNGFLPLFPATSHIAIGGAAGAKLRVWLIGTDGSEGEPVEFSIPAGRTTLLTPSQLRATESTAGIRFSLDSTQPLGLAAVLEDDPGIAVMTPTHAYTQSRSIPVLPLTP